MPGRGGTSCSQDNPQVCVWVDPKNEVAESDENDNLFCIRIEPDAYEDDDSAAACDRDGWNGPAT